ncbi:hypothetical protein ACQP3F_26285, partial [Escherichia coli]
MSSGQPDLNSEFQARQGYIVRSYLKTQKEIAKSTNNLGEERERCFQSVQGNEVWIQAHTRIRGMLSYPELVWSD